jgi:transposase
MMELEMAQLDHFGLVAGVFDQLGISEVIDDRLPKSRHHKLSHSQILKAMVLNGLGFVGQRLYLFPSFFENLPVDKLLGEGVVAADLNDDVLGRTFDAIYEYDPTNLFNEIVLKVMDRVDFDTKLLHADTTSFGVHGMWSEPLRVDKKLSNADSWREVHEEDKAALRPGLQDISISRT